MSMSTRRMSGEIFIMKETDFCVFCIFIVSAINIIKSKSEVNMRITQDRIGNIFFFERRSDSVDYRKKIEPS